MYTYVKNMCIYMNVKDQNYLEFSVLESVAYIRFCIIISD